MMNIVAIQSRKVNGKVNIIDTEGENTLSNNVEELLSSLVAPYPNCIKVVWNMETFLKPIVKLLPQEVVKKLNNGDRARFGDFKLFYGVGKGAVFGVDWDVIEHQHGNFYSKDHYESNIYELKLYYPNETPDDVNDIKAKGQFLINTLNGMGLNPTKITSPASIYEECILRDMDLYRMGDMPDDTIEFAEWAANYMREWRCTYKLGYFKEAFDADLSSAYASVLAKIPDFKNSHYIKTNGTIPKNTFWGLLQGELDITADVSHIVYDDGKCYGGKRPDLISTTDWACLKRWNIGTFSPTKGWFVTFDKLDYIFDAPMRDLYSLRGSGNELQERIAKNMAASTWAKFAQRIGERFGDYYFPLIPSMVTSKVRCIDCDFIYSNKLTEGLISVTVDGCLGTTKPNTPTTKEFGAWRLNGNGEALILGQGFEWLLDKKPLGKTLPQILEAIHKHPQSHSYYDLGLRFVEQSRNFESLPTTGRELIENTYNSKPSDYSIKYKGE